MGKPKILITNDDGINAKGIWHLWRALKDRANITIVAPAIEKSGVGLSLTLRKPLSIQPVTWESKAAAWKINGTPADCVRFGMRMVLKDEKPDLIVSGINRGSNAGRNVLYSGTIGGVIEGSMRDIPGIAFSNAEFDDPSYDHIEPHIFPIVKHILEHPLSSGTILNVNFPVKSLPLKGIKLARQGRGLWVEDPDQRIHPDGDTYFWQGGQWSDHDEHDESDVALLKEGYITATPIHVDELTDHDFIQEHKEHFETNLKPFSS